MIGRKHLFFWRLVPALLMAAGLGAAASAAEVSAVRFGSDSSMTRVVIESDTALDYRMFTLAEQGLRLVVDLQHVDWRIDGEPATGGQRRAEGEGLVSQYRFAQNSPEVSRLVLDLSAPAEVTQHFVLPPSESSAANRLVLDLTPTSFEKFAEASGQTMETPPVPQARITSAPALAAAKPVIVIDAGHGGKDPGARGATGKWEKAVNLSAALALRDILQATGRYEVVLTRSTDVFLELDERVGIARGRGADLFISLHSDSAENKSARGASVYTLSDSGAARARSKVMTNDWVMDVTLTGRPEEVSGILLDLAQRDTKNQSAAFAEMLTGDLETVSPLLRNSHREAGYYVLLAPDVPAVLLEMGFMSNIHDEANLASDGYRRRLMGAVADSIDAYFSARQLRFVEN